jgi:uncharacterized membrane protein
MNMTWKTIFLIGAFLLAAMAIYAIWLDAAVPEVLVKSFLSLVVGGLLLTVLQSTLGRPDKTES